MDKKSIPHLFHNTMEACLAKAFLEANGIESELSDDTPCETLENNISAGEIRLVVDAPDYQTACNLLSENGFTPPVQS